MGMGGMSGSASPLHPDDAPRRENDGVPMSRFYDGTSNTILLVQTQREVPWTKPEDVPFHPDRPLPELGGYFPGGFHALFADGNVSFASERSEGAALSALIQRASVPSLRFGVRESRIG
jgi:prepilin-type processing-associated H-X9-DG protein